MGPVSPRAAPNSARASSAHAAARPGLASAYGLPGSGQQQQQQQQRSIIRPLPPSSAGSGRQQRALASESLTSTYGVYSAKAAAAARKIKRGDNIVGLDDCAPLVALRPNPKRPTVLELGPREPSTGSDLVRTGVVGVDPFAALGQSPLTEEELATLSREQKAQRVGKQTALQKVRAEVQQAATISSKMDGHAEAAITVLREFFANRPMDVLLEVFRNQDDDVSGALDLNEFKAGLRKLNLDLSEKDMRAVFNAADLDNSGEVDLDEFFNCFRKDAFPRDTFFWSDRRPRELLGRMDRVRLAQSLEAGAITKDWSQAEITDIVQQKVEQFSVKDVFNSLDDNRSGRINVREFVGAMREMDIMIPDEKCEQIFRDLNGRVGDDTSTHITFRAFSNVFDKGSHAGTSGSDEAVVKQVVDHAPGLHLWRKDAGKLDAAAVRDTKYGRFGGTPAGEELDSIERTINMIMSPAKLAASFTDRGKVYEDEIEQKMALMKRSDQLSEWRQSSVQGGDGVQIAVPQRNIDWQAFQLDQSHRLLGRGAAPSARGTLPGAPASGKAQMAVVRAARAARARQKAEREAWEADALALQESNLRHTVAGAFCPVLDSPSYASEAVRLSRRDQMWSPAASEQHSRRLDRWQAQHERQAARDEAVRARNEREHTKIEMRDWHKYLAQVEYAQRTNDWQQVIESREMENGRQKILLEPPSSDATDAEGNALWKYAPPHVTSHWDTISRVNKDPPPRTHIKTISAYRKYFPAVDNRPPTPRHPVWGGNRDDLYSRDASAASPRGGIQSRDSAREALLSPR